MDTRGYPYPPMDDLLRRQNQAGQGGFDPNNLDGGDLNGGDGLHRKPGESDIGSGLELDRSLQRVAAQEALLTEKSKQPVESWLESRGAQSIELVELGVNAKAEKGDSDNNRNLIAVDQRSIIWEKYSQNLPSNTDILIIEADANGSDRIKEYLKSCDSALYDEITVIGSLEAADKAFLGSDEFSVQGLANKINDIKQTHLINDSTEIKLFTANSLVASAEAVSLNYSEAELIQRASKIISSSISDGRLQNALNQAYPSAKHSFVFERVNKFLTGNLSPSIEG